MTLNHIAIIPDGNGRWATQNGKTKSEGHLAGAEAAKRILEAAGKNGIRHLSLYGFSSENWKRTDKEVSDLMDIMVHYLTNARQLLAENNVKLQVIGDKTKLSDTMQESIKNAEELTKTKNDLNLYIAISYGGKDEIARAIKKIIDKNISSDEINEELIRQNLDIPDMPDVDFVIRTSGENRLSNFLIWQTTYSELYFSEKLWPDFNEEDLKLAIEEFNNRKRNFGYAREQIR